MKIKNIGKTQRRTEASKLPDLLSATVLTGKDAARFIEAVNNPKPIPCEDYARAKNTYDQMIKNNFK
jgi:hypothetical protein